MIAFAHIQKTGGTTLVGLLRRNLGPLHADVEPVHEGDHYYRTTYGAADHRWTRRMLPGLASIAGHRVKPCSDLHRAVPDVRYHTWVRDPLKRTASHYQHAVQKLGWDQGFEVWSQRWEMADLMCRHLGGTGRFEDAAEAVTRTACFVGMLEHFDESLVLFGDWVARPRLDLRYERRNVAEDSSLKRQVLADPDSRARLEAMNQQDLALYAWLRDEVWPQQVARYGAERLQRDAAALADATRERSWSVREGAARAVRNLWYKPVHRLACTVAGR